jgi:hypothetical protein
LVQGKQQPAVPAKDGDDLVEVHQSYYDVSRTLLSLCVGSGIFFLQCNCGAIQNLSINVGTDLDIMISAYTSPGRLMRVMPF